MSFEINLENKVIQFHLELDLDDLMDHLIEVSRNKLNENLITKYFNEHPEKLNEYLDLCEKLMVAYGTCELDEDDIIINNIKKMEVSVSKMN